MNPYTFQTAGKIVSGCNSTKNLMDHLKVIGEVRSVLLITQPNFLRRDFVVDMISQLSEAGISVDTNTDVLPEPTIDNVEAIHAKIAKQSFDLYIGVGGGSVLDATKLLSARKTNHKSLYDMLGSDLIEHKGLPMVLIPTTSGTGSEVTPNAIVTIPDQELKIGIVSRYLLPELVIMDPVVTISLPKAITAATGMDAFTHSFESFISNKANPISDMFALESIRLIAHNITTAFHEGTNLVARENMMLGSMYGGMALTSAGTAAVHALAYPLGGKFNIPHGVANSMLLPHVTEFNLDAMEERLVPVAKAMGLVRDESLSSAQAAQLVIQQIVAWTKELEIPQNLKAFGVIPADLPILAEAAMKVTRLLNNNPKSLTSLDAENIYRKLLS